MRDTVGIARLTCYGAVLPLRREVYRMSHGRQLTELETTIVEVVDENGIAGYGEACTLGASYIDGFAGSVRAAVRHLAPTVMAHDVFDPGGLNAAMDASLLGHRPAKAAIDAAFWDLRGKLLDQPAAALLGGRRQDRIPLFAAVSLASPEEMAAEATAIRARGCVHFQLKLGDDSAIDVERAKAVYAAVHEHAQFITCDGNRGWTPAQARLFLARVQSLEVFIEQPCKQLSDLAQIRRISSRPIVADESIREPADLVDCLRLEAADAINIKPTRVGGLTKAARLRDLAEAAGMMVMIDEPGGSEIAGAGILQMAATCAPDSFLCAAYVPAAVTKSLAETGDVLGDGYRWGYPPMQPGLGIQVDEGLLGDPLFTCAHP